jgi:hypothetical protein
LQLAEENYHTNQLKTGDYIMQSNGSLKKTIYLLLFGDLDETYSEKLHQQLESVSSQNFDEVIFNFAY